MSAGARSFDLIVVGLGAMGAATLYQLARRGARVLGIDRFAPLHAFGSSHGETRITRLAIGEGEHYTPFAIRSHEIWRELELLTQQRLLCSTGGLIIANSNRADTFHGKPGFLETTIRAATRWGIPHELLTSQEMQRRFPNFLLSSAEAAYFEPEAGYLRPEACISAQLQEAQRLGALVSLHEQVLDLEPQMKGGVSVRTSAGTYYAEQLVLAVGSWIRHFVPAYAKRFMITRQVLYWFDCDDATTRFGVETNPVFVWAFGPGEEQGVYGFPAIDGQRGGVKVAPSTYDRVVDPDSVDRAVTPEEIQATYERYVQGRIQFLEPRCVKTATCLYTITPDSDFVIGRLPEAQQLIIVSPCSGHGFKHSAAIGESVAELALLGSSSRDLKPFSLARFSS